MYTYNIYIFTQNIYFFIDIININISSWPLRLYKLLDTLQIFYMYVFINIINYQMIEF